ncbi:MAG: hypothetical protein O3C63_02975 [Cyanobacteria bacterium]|nr:hypothetical protein [Cyanobacteriota bacterium]MDA1020029.1 hypothetical protein [Cyanobacteriota bacterium]
MSLVSTIQAGPLLSADNQALELGRERLEAAVMSFDPRDLNRSLAKGDCGWCENVDYILRKGLVEDLPDITKAIEPLNYASSVFLQDMVLIPIAKTLARSMTGSSLRITNQNSLAKLFELAPLAYRKLTDDLREMTDNFFNCEQEVFDFGEICSQTNLFRPLSEIIGKYMAMVLKEYWEPALAEWTSKN